jgi:hypothetical protein
MDREVREPKSQSTPQDPICVPGTKYVKWDCRAFWTLQYFKPSKNDALILQNGENLQAHIKFYPIIFLLNFFNILIAQKYHENWPIHIQNWNYFEYFKNRIDDKKTNIF